jgi:hypothetical protein
MVVLGEVTLDWTSPSRSGNTVFLVTEVLAQYNVLFGQASVTEYFMDRDFQFALLMNPPTEGMG